MSPTTMKPAAIAAMLAILALLQCCGSQRELAFDYPPNLAPDSQLVFVDHFKQGHILYDENCARCHTKVVNGERVIPDFTIPQLLDYEMRFTYPAHEEPLREVNVSAKELDDIQLFLQYKRPSGVWANPDFVPLFMRQKAVNTTTPPATSSP